MTINLSIPEFFMSEWWIVPLIVYTALGIIPGLLYTIRWVRYVGWVAEPTTKEQNEKYEKRYPKGVVPFFVLLWFPLSFAGCAITILGALVLTILMGLFTRSK